MKKFIAVIIAIAFLVHSPQTTVDSSFCRGLLTVDRGLHALRPAATTRDEVGVLQEALKQAKKEDDYNPQYFIDMAHKMAHKNLQYVYLHIIEAFAAIKKLPAGDEFFILQDDIEFIKTMLAYRERIAKKKIPWQLKNLFERISILVSQNVKSADRCKHFLDREFKDINVCLGKVLAETISQTRQDFLKDDTQLHQLIEQESAIMQYLCKPEEKIPEAEDEYGKLIRQLEFEREEQKALKVLEKIKQNIKLYRRITEIHRERLSSLMLHMIEMAKVGLVGFIRVNPKGLIKGDICIAGGEIFIFEGKAEEGIYNFTIFDCSRYRGLVHTSIVNHGNQFVKLDTGNVAVKAIVDISSMQFLLGSDTPYVNFNSIAAMQQAA